MLKNNKALAVLAGAGYVLAASLIFDAVALAEPLPRSSVPEPLQPWLPWVLHEIPDIDCPFLATSFKHRYCAWPETLELAVDESGARFNQAWQVFAKQYVALPGDSKLWPQQVKVNGKTAVVDVQGQTPMIYLQPGKYSVSGTMSWKEMPQYLSLPIQTGLIRLSINGTAVKNPKLAVDGKLWIQENQPQSVAKSLQDSVEIEVFRHIQDQVPLRLTTRIQLEVSGRSREISVGPIYPGSYIPLFVHSQLPARLDEQGILQIQARPGRWSVDVIARATGPVEQINLPVSSLPESEIWVFAAEPQLRIVEIKGVPAIDPRQTRLPPEWQHLPAYQVTRQDSFLLETKQRGDPTPAPNRLHLARDLWLDFSGNGFTFRDKIDGEMHSGWRLNMGSGLSLGRAQVAGIDQLISKEPGSGLEGVEIRQAKLNALVAGRIEGPARQLPALGWRHDFETVTTQLNLPPGWRLLSVQGVDRVAGNSWVERWTLLDLFLVLIASLSARRLFGNQWAVIVFVCLGLSWHEPDAPRYIWLNLLAVIALLKVVPEGRARKWLDYYRYGSLALLMLISLPYIVDTVRESLYPQLAQPGRITTFSYQRDQESAMPEQARSEQARVTEQDEQAPILSSEPMQKGMLSSPPMSSVEEKLRRAKPAKGSVSGRMVEQPRMLQAVDPNAKVQTGPGLPNWNWSRSSLRFHGPVKQDQQIRIFMLPPAMTALFNISCVLLIMVLIWRMLELKLGAQFPGKLLTGSAALLLLTLPTGPGAQAAVTQAAFPDLQLLQKLKEKLSAKPDCLPDCAQISRMLVQMDKEQLRLTLEVHAGAQVAVPLPGSDRHWRPERVLLGDRMLPVSKGEQADLQVLLEPGRHKLIMEGRLPDLAQFQLGLPLKPHFVETQLSAWRVRGLHKDGTVENQLSFDRLDLSALSETTGNKVKASQLPAFVQIERTLLFGLEWRIHTRVRRLSEPGTAIALEFPLLAGESVLTEAVPVKDGKAQFQLAAQQNRLDWESSLAVRESITLSAAKTTDWVELWRLRVSPLWRLQSNGLVAIQHKNARGEWIPEWRPWPGEALDIQLHKPEPAAGVTKTIDNSSLQINPGQRISQYNLTLNIRSSQADHQVVRLPDGVDLQKVEYDGRQQPIQSNDQTLRIPLRPGEQNVQIQWQQAQGMATWFQSVPLNIETASVNSSTSVTVPRNRWVLYLGGPRLGPAVLIWGVMLVVVLLAFALSRSQYTPLKFYQWLLLGIGLTQAYVIGVGLVVAWFYAMAWRQGKGADMPRKQFNGMQLGLAILSLLALVSLLAAVGMGLLGYPDMQISGNGSHAYELRWYSDRSAEELATVWIVSLPLWIYRVLMLIWSLWLAFAMLSWLKWAWKNYSENGLWRHLDLVKPPATQAVTGAAAEGEAGRLALPESSGDSGKGEK